ncbi:MAG TPA: MFS transporter [Steroidobacteraceae bacterium]|jgi:DHA1 family tetracycline resistance protein-like MFS transporter|nr:MFS transporter [Steroidobacteraceae bacterium]
MRTLFLVCVIDILGFGILVPLVPYMADRFGVTPAFITPILGVYSLCQLIAAPLWGRLSDRYGRRPILISSLAGACVSYLLLGVAHDVAALVVARALAGFMAGNIAAAFAYASDISTPAKRAQSMGMVGAAIGIGFMLGPAIGGLLAGDDIGSANFLRPAMLSAALSLVAIALVYWMLRESHAPERRTQSGRPARAGAVALLLARPGLRAIAAASFLVTCSQAIFESIFAIWAMHKFGFGPRAVGLVLFSLAVIAVGVQGGLVRMLAPRFGEMRVAICGVALYVAGLLMVAGAPGLTLAFMGLACCGIGGGAFIPCASALASKQADARERGAVMGTYQAGASLARALVPLASGAIYVGLGPSAPFLAGSVLTAPAAWLVWRASRAPRLHRDSSSL